jgi:fibro-slime domain-containing protein
MSPSIRASLRVVLPLVLTALLSRCGGNPQVPQDDSAHMAGGGGGGGSGGTVNTGGNRPIEIGQGGAVGGDTGEGGSGGENPGGPICGDGKRDPGEGCDDNNAQPGDGCNGACRIEPDYECPTPGEACVYDVKCGDSRITGNEACDDGNADDGDGCSAECTVERGYSCTDAGEPCTPAQTAACGNGAVEFGEQCDDHNAAPDDGCDASCQQEPGFHCPDPGEACVADVFCGDGRISSGETCDDGNAKPGDGCNGACQPEPFFECDNPGEPCISTILCGDGKVVGDEVCDDGNADDGDGCAADCRSVIPGYVCPPKGGACVVERCGDGQISSHSTSAECLDANPNNNEGCEFCDDGNDAAGDGCSSSCVIENGYNCPNVGKPCISLTKCGDRVVNGQETCDDGNTKAKDGCSATCQVEAGWSCSAGQRCVAKECGDGIIAGNEQCDDHNATANDGCSDTCTLELGYACDTAGVACHKTTCGDGKTEGFEQCDDHNTVPFDGCSPQCASEPKCADATGKKIACTKVCGDGIKFPNEACDDGNTRNGDGCSDACEIEAGFQCPPPTSDPPALVLPVIYRDFAPGAPTAVTAGATGTRSPDFQWGEFSSTSGTGYYNAAATAQNRINYDFGGLTTGFAAAGLFTGTAGDVHIGKPTFGYTTTNCPLSLTGATGNWLRRDGFYDCANTVRDTASFGDWFTIPAAPALAGSPSRTMTLVRCPLVTPAANSPCVAGDNGTYLFDSNTMLPSADINNLGASFCGTDCDGFFPLDDLSKADSDCGTTSRNGRADKHNFHFTSEVHHWFQYLAANNATLTFSGDDDVFVFVNGRLVVDIGGIHNRLQASVTLNATTKDLGGTLLNLVDGGIYEIGVFQAERNRCASNYRLQLKNFAFQSSVCTPVCGDGVVTPGEECDEGSANVAPSGNTYGKCTTSCTLGPRCGDAVKNGSELCDNGVNTDVYVTSSGGNACAPGCKLPASCGDGNINGANGEQCDGGTANNTGAYGHCRPDCRLGPRCGDGIKNGTEECDDGKNDGTYGTCSPSCVLPPRCGDGAIQAAQGEKCDNGADNIAPNSSSAYGPDLCTTACRPAPYCGDHAVDASRGEVCDDGVNSGAPGSCAPDCKSYVDLASCGDGKRDNGEDCDDGTNNGTKNSSCDVRCRTKCGNGIKDSGEECDDGVNDGTWGTCNADCTLAGYCGDGDLNGPEECDPPTANQSNLYGPNTCTAACKKGPYCGDGRIQPTFGEECDSTSQCDNACKAVIIR